MKGCCAALFVMRIAPDLCQTHIASISCQAIRSLSTHHFYNETMTGVADLHCHSRYSDGTLTATDLMILAHNRGVRMIALTDHDEVSGIAEARAQALRSGMQFISGVEISSEWQGVGIHVVGLRIDESDLALQHTLSAIRTQRAERARRMDEAFSQLGIAGVLAGATAYAPNPNLISRTHFARHLIDRRICSSMSEVFARFMKPGKPGYVPQTWLPMSDAIAVIRRAGGRAVLAHPGRYEVDPHGGANALLRGFAESGGEGVEVVCAAHHPPEWAQYAALSRKFGLLASIGSDFHSPSESRVRFGDLPRLSPTLKPVWHDWPEAEVLHAQPS